MSLDSERASGGGTPRLQHRSQSTGCPPHGSLSRAAAGRLVVRGEVDDNRGDDAGCETDACVVGCPYRPWSSPLAKRGQLLRAPGAGPLRRCRRDGGHAAGEVASQLAVDAIKNVVEDTRALGPQDTWPIALDPAIGRDGNRLRAGFDLANRQIADRVASTAALRGMATTAVAVLVAEATTALAHVGDSRAYLYRDDELSRLTRDHSWVEEQIQAGMLSEAAAREHPWRNIVTRALNGGKGLEVEVAELELREGDRLLLCSDGLSSVLTDTEIGRVLSTNADRQAICDELVRRVIAGGAPDNVTTLVLDIDTG